MGLQPLDPRDVLGLEPGQLPGHVAIIMDGNGRWAQQRGQPRTLGHRQGAETVDRVATVAARLGLGQLTLYAFSTENWQRSRDETDALMHLYADFLQSHRGKILDNAIRFRQIGRRDRLPADVLQQVEQVEQQTHDAGGMTLCLAVDYGGRQEIVDAVRRICRQVLAGHLDPDQIDQDVLAGALYTGGMPEPDLLIRTAGGMRLSNFLLWQVSYAELYVTPVLWPDFGEEDFCAALRDFAGRERRFGRAPGTG